jgi:hypothetical protein
LITNWLIAKNRNPNTYSFTIVELDELQSYDRQNIINYLADLLTISLVNPERLEDIFRQAGLEQTIEFLKMNIVDRKIPILIGDFGEIIGSEVINHFDNYYIPIPKLWFREKNNWPMRLTDILGIKMKGNKIIDFCLCEVKTRTVWNKKCETIGLDAYKELESESKKRIPEIFEFEANALHNIKNYKLASIFDYYLYSAGLMNISRCYVAILLFDKRYWKEIVLDNLESAPVILDKFHTKLIRISDLRKLIDDGYRRVIEKING